MAETLGEKLRQAREQKGISLGEVAEQTRISPLYIEAIDNDDYRGLPGGIFNRGFVKSYAKYVGVDEQEALSDYAKLLYEIEGDVEDVKFHRPEVLTDDRAPASMLPTLIVAVVVLGIMTFGVLFILRQLQPGEQTAGQTSTIANTNSANANSPESENIEQVDLPPPPDMSTLKVELRAVNISVPIMLTIDGQKRDQTITPGSTTVFEPKESIKFSYSRFRSQYFQLAINGKNITLATPNPQRPMIEFEINKQNLAEIWATGVISNDNTTAALAANATIPPVQQQPVQPRFEPPKNPPANPPPPRVAFSPRPAATFRPSTPVRPANRP